MKSVLRSLYRTLELPGMNPLKDAHSALNAACGFSVKKDLLARLRKLNKSVAQRLEKALPVIPAQHPGQFPNTRHPDFRQLHQSTCPI